jgi:23S rRNA (uracil1939-C5)-methyltransferase
MLLTIEKMIYGGDGLARIPPQPGDAAPNERGKAVFVPFVLEGEQVEATLVEQKQSFARARIERIVSPSPERREAPCRYYQRCGGCHYQHTGDGHQLAIKVGILKENLSRLAKLDWQEDVATHPSPPWNYRNRSRMQLRHQPGFSLGYFQHDSHDVLPVKECPISSPLINRTIVALWKLGCDQKLPPTLREVEIFSDAADAKLLLEFYATSASPERNAGTPTSRSRRADADDQYRGMWSAIHAELPEAVGTAIFASAPGRTGSAAREPALLASFGDPEIVYRTADESYRVSAGSFFQTNRHMVDKLVEIVTADRGGGLALDLYAGVGLFANPLSRTFKRVIAVEAGTSSHRDLRRNAHENVQAVHAPTEHYLERATLQGAAELVVVDPPRAGLGEKVVRALARIAPQRVTYVSCDPATLSRDLRMLIESGLRVEQIHLIDLFPQTFHIESVVQLVR